MALSHTVASPSQALRLAMAACITGYQRHLSPHKGFRCAHRVLHGKASCSQYVKGLLLRRRLREAPMMIWRRFQACKAAYLTLVAAQPRRQEEREPNSRGDFDAGDCVDVGECALEMGSCDLGVPSLDCGGCAF